jgi:hypothetical protein
VVGLGSNMGSATNVAIVRVPCLGPCSASSLHVLEAE